MKELKEEWWKYHKKNPQVYELFERYTFQVIQRGYKHYGAKGVMERIRWHTDVETEGDRFKISNNHTAYYARLFEHYHPQFEGFFRKKDIEL